MENTVVTTDSIFFQGHTHDICQDYSLTGVLPNGLSYAMVADGCSGASDYHVDFGARILCHNAVKVLSQFQKMEDFNKIETYEMLKEKTIFYSDFCAKELNLTENALACTLLIAISDGKTALVYMYGDGCIISRTNDNKNKVIKVNYTGNAPFYISYLLNKQNFDKFVHSGQRKLTYVSIDYEPMKLTYSQEELTSFAIYTFDCKDLSTLSICSDGIESFNKDSDNIPVEHMVDRFTGFKNYSGEFVKRRLKAMKRECEMNKIRHDDDISIATMYVKG